MLIQVTDETMTVKVIKIPTANATDLWRLIDYTLNQGAVVPQSSIDFGNELRSQLPRPD